MQVVATFLLKGKLADIKAHIERERLIVATTKNERLLDGMEYAVEEIERWVDQVTLKL